MAALQRKGHQQALLAWEIAKGAATKLVEQARRLAARLLEAVQPERLAAWARERLQRGQLQRDTLDRVPAVPAKLLQPLQSPRQPVQLNLSQYSLKDQHPLCNNVMDELKVAGKMKVQWVAAKVTQRLERRQSQAKQSEADPPHKPRGLWAAFKKSEYDGAVKAYWQRLRQGRNLVEEAAKLQKKVLEATHRSEGWAARRLSHLQPEFVERVERYVRGNNQRVQMEDLEAHEKLWRERGIEGPKLSR